MNDQILSLEPSPRKTSWIKVCKFKMLFSHIDIMMAESYCGRFSFLLISGPNMVLSTQQYVLVGPRRLILPLTEPISYNLCLPSGIVWQLKSERDLGQNL